MIVGVVILILLALPASAQHPTPGPGRADYSGGGGGDCSEIVTDAFSTDPFSSRFTRALNDDPDCRFIHSAGTKVRWDTVTAAVNCPDNQPRATHNNTTLGSYEQYACVTYLGHNTDRVFGPGVTLRAASASATSDFYSLFWDLPSGTNAHWGAADFGADIGTCTITAIVASDVLCARIEGTGQAGSEASFWTNPTGSTPDDWGAPDCCINDTGAGSCVADGGRLSEAAARTDSGDYAGLRLYVSNSQNGSLLDFDDFVGGECAP